MGNKTTLIKWLKFYETIYFNDSFLFILIACESEVEHFKDRKETNCQVNSQSIFYNPLSLYTPEPDFFFLLNMTHFPQNPDAEMLNYAALRFTQKKGEGRRKTREMEVLYSDVKLTDWEGE